MLEDDLAIPTANYWLASSCQVRLKVKDSQYVSFLNQYNTMLYQHMSSVEIDTHGF